MNYQVKHLKLFEPLNFSVKTSSETDFSTEFEEQLISFVNKVPANSINPEKTNFLTEKKYLGSKANDSEENLNQILPGDYFFVQYFLDEKDFCDKNKITTLLEDLAEAIFLEALWQEIKFADNIIYARKLKEGKFAVFQLFVRIIKNN